MQNIQLEQVRYYQGCSSSVPSDTMPDPLTVQNTQGTIKNIKMETTVPIIGYSEDNNYANFTFTPATALSQFGGSIQISGPIWYAS